MAENMEAAGRTLIIRVTKVSRGLFKQKNQYRFVILGRNHKIVAIGEDYTNLADLVSAVFLITGVTIRRQTGETIVTIRWDSTYSISTRG